MKHFGLAVLGAFVLLFISAMGLTHLSAATSSAVPGSSGQTTVNIRQFNGAVVSLDLEAKRLIVKNRKSESAFALTPKTAYKQGRSTIQPVELKPGMKVEVRYYEQDGQRLAKQVSITSAAVNPLKGGQ